VEKNNDITARSTLHLANAGYEVVTAEHAIAGGKALLVQSPDLIITGINMPDMTGIEFVAALRADRTIPPIPVIFLSSRQEDLERLLGVVALHAEKAGLRSGSGEAGRW
jgi:two-component system, OmpR family, phosphate regulon response regulator PhoB